MRKILISAAILQMLGGVAFAGSSSGQGSRSTATVDGAATASGPTAYANAATLWAAQRNDPKAPALSGWLLPTSGKQPG